MNHSKQIKGELIAAIKNGDQERALILAEKFQGNRPYLISLAAQHGHDALVLQIMNAEVLQHDYQTHQDHPLVHVVINGNLDVVQTLLPLTPDKYHTHAVEAAIYCRHDNILDFLLEHCENINHRCLERAVRNGSVSQVQKLLPHCDPKNFRSYILYEAARTKNDDVFEVIYQVCEPQKALDYLLNSGYTYDDHEVVWISQRIEADVQREVIEAAVSCSSRYSVKRKM